MTKSARWMLYMQSGTRFFPVDWKSGNVVRNKIFASLFTDDEKEIAQKSLDHPDNAELVFQWRPLRKSPNTESTP